MKPNLKASAGRGLPTPVSALRASDELPTHDDGSERAALACVMDAGINGSQAEVETLLHQLRPTHFYDARCREIHAQLVAQKMAGHAVDLVTASTWLEGQKKWEAVGGRDYWGELFKAPLPYSFFYNYLPTLKEMALRRWCLAKTVRLNELARATELSPDILQAEFGDLYEKSVTIGAGSQPLIHVITPAQARAFEPDPDDFLVGAGLITRGMFITIGGEPGVGKSRLATTLAVAGARGNNRWMNYPVRCKWRTLILQSENSGTRLKGDFEPVPKQFDDDILVSDVLPHGLAFENPEFRRELRRLFDEWPFQMLVVDPWNDVCPEDGQKDYKQAMLNIAGVFRGVKMPALVIVAHLRKRGRDEAQRRKSGRELLHELSGSLALGSTSRTVFVVQNVETAMDDPRIVFEVAKANDCHPDWLKEYGVRSAWVRANGAFESCDIDWQRYDNPGEPERRAVTEDMILAAFDGETEMKAAQVSKRLKSLFKVGESTAFRAIGEDGYLRAMLMRTGTGKLKLKEARP